MTPVVAECLPAVFLDAQRRVWRHGLGADFPPSRRVPEETPIAFAYQGASYAVMMAIPADLADFALGFSLNEGIVSSLEEIESLEIIAAENGVLLRIALVECRADDSGSVGATSPAQAAVAFAVWKALPRPSMRRLA